MRPLVEVPHTRLNLLYGIILLAIQDDNEFIFDVACINASVHAPEFTTEATASLSTTTTDRAASPMGNAIPFSQKSVPPLNICSAGLI